MTEPNPFDTLQQVAGGYCVSRCLHVIAELGVADCIGETPCTTPELAGEVGADPDALGRALRLLSTHGLFEARGDAFGHSPASRLLRSDHPQSMRNFARMIGLPINWAIYGALEHSLRTGRPATEQVLPDGYWNHFEAQPQDGRVFNAAMEAKAHGQIAGVIAAYDFDGFATVGDIGGGRGHLLRAVLDSAPRARGVLFDLSRVIEETAAVASERLTLQAGDFFRDALPACDLYLMMDIIHDWGDKEALAILKAIRRDAPTGARLLLIETMLSDDPGPDWAKMLDVHMLVLLGGRQRTRHEYAELLKQSNFAFRREIDTRAGISIVEAEIV
ncbi:MAG: methyltransferase [Gammaproteobacteria bacterium]